MSFSFLIIQIYIFIILCSCNGVTFRNPSNVPLMYDCNVEQPGQDCYISCFGAGSCYKTVFICPTNTYECHIQCTTGNAPNNLGSRSCSTAYIEAVYTEKLHLICSAYGCYQMTINITHGNTLIIDEEFKTSGNNRAQWRGFQNMVVLGDYLNSVDITPNSYEGLHNAELYFNHAKSINLNCNSVNGIYVCSRMKLYAKYAGNINVHCLEIGCYFACVDAEEADMLNILCDGDGACYHMDIRCPRNNNCTMRFNGIGNRFPVGNINFYAENKFDMLDISCAEGSCVYDNTKNVMTLNYNQGYNQFCNIHWDSIFGVFKCQEPAQQELLIAPTDNSITRISDFVTMVNTVQDATIIDNIVIICKITVYQDRDVIISLYGPIDRWFGIGFGTDMNDLPSIIVKPDSKPILRHFRQRNQGTFITEFEFIKVDNIGNHRNMTFSVPKNLTYFGRQYFIFTDDMKEITAVAGYGQINILFDESYIMGGHSGVIIIPLKANVHKFTIHITFWFGIIFLTFINVV